MNHGSSKRKFGRETKQRKALMVSLAVALIDHDRITTTQAKAKELRPYIEKLVTKSKNVNVGVTRDLASSLPKMSVTKLTKEIGPRYADRKGGYTRIRAIPARLSDGAKMAIIEFIK
jgi:large subunit ribosomal protein L17